MSRPVPSKIALRSSLVAEWGTLPMKTLVGFLENNIVIHFEIMSFMALLICVWKDLRVGEFHFEPLPFVCKAAKLPHCLLGALVIM